MTQEDNQEKQEKNSDKANLSSAESESHKSQLKTDPPASPAAMSNIFQAAIWTSCLWYPYVSFYACCIATIIVAPFVSNDLLPRFANSFVRFAYILPPITFVALVVRSNWFRRWCHWSLLSWLAMSMITSTTEGALTSGCLRAYTDFQTQFKPQTSPLAK